ncbi:ADM_collapsed_G0045870.mRNA.1.CDS.1 [Saccharomyces cerevisiae]|nr:ADM_collapsed_G0045870.mRNA.1.CDS.1 [Saccharomyces cerevisiae]
MGIDDKDAVINSPSEFVHDAFSNDALNVLRGMLKEWWDEALKENATADLLVNSLASWVQNPNANYSTDY